MVIYLPLSTRPQNLIRETKCPRFISNKSLKLFWILTSFLVEAFPNNCSISTGTVCKCIPVVPNSHLGSCIMVFKSVSCIEPNTKFLQTFETELKYNTQQEAKSCSCCHRIKRFAVAPSLFFDGFSKKCKFICQYSRHSCVN